MYSSNLSKIGVIFNSFAICAFVLYRILLRMKNVSDKSYREKSKHILCSVIFFFENRAVYEIMWKNIVERGRTQMTLWGMRIACWIPKATNTHTHSVCIIFVALPLQQRVHERTSLLRYTYIACLVEK